MSDTNASGQLPCHIHSTARQRQTYEYYHWAYHHRRKHLVEKLLALPLYECAHHKIHERHSHQSGKCARHAPLLARSQNRGYKRKARPQKYGHFALGDQMKYQRSHTGGQQSRGRVHAHKERHKHCGAKGHEKKLHTHYCFAHGCKVCCWHILFYFFTFLCCLFSVCFAARHHRVKSSTAFTKSSSGMSCGSQFIFMPRRSIPRNHVICRLANWCMAISS